VRDRGAGIAEKRHVIGIEPDPVRDREMRSDHAEAVKMRGLRAAVDLQARHGLHLRLGDVAVQSDSEIAGQRGATKDKGVRAMMRDRRRDGGADMVAVERPII
jgi:hypothetical protein